MADEPQGRNLLGEPIGDGAVHPSMLQKSESVSVVTTVVFRRAISGGPDNPVGAIMAWLRGLAPKPQNVSIESVTVEPLPEDATTAPVPGAAVQTPISQASGAQVIEEATGTESLNGYGGTTVVAPREG